ncbi:hypothetical protein LNQ52_16665 [Klebsiella pneumoniae subsp. pneumoniae]|nr:hypothetical protein [Klebsiella pneumoniae subsp. pneumoniae]
MDGSFDVEGGLKIARVVCWSSSSILGLPLATEALDPNSPQHTWGSVQLVRYRRAYHRNHKRTAKWPLACRCRSAYKTGTDGSLATAINAMRAAGDAAPFLGASTGPGRPCLLQTQGNPNGL